MSIRDRVADAELLWKAGRVEGAWVQALIAAAATARKRYPQVTSDNQCFKSFIRDVGETIILGISPPLKGVRFIFADIPFEDIFYNKIRCFLVHEGSLSSDVVFSESKMVDGNLMGLLKMDTPVVIPDFFCMHLVQAVREAPENQAEFAVPG